MITVAVLLVAGVFQLVFGLLGLVARLVMLPFRLTHRGNAPMPSEPEQNLQRAARGAGCAAMLLLVIIVVDANGGGSSIAAVIRAPGNAGVVAIVYAFLLGLSVVQLIIGAVGCWGLRKKELAVAAFFKIAFGLGTAAWLWQHFQLLRLPDLPPWALATAWFLHWWLLFVAQMGFGASVWFIVTGAVRFLLLTLGGSGALRRVLRHIGQRLGRLRPARPRSY